MMAAMTVAAPRPVRLLSRVAALAGLAAVVAGCTFPGRPGTPPTTKPVTTKPATPPPTTVRSSTTTTVAAPGGSAVVPPPPNAGFDYQIGGPYAPPAGVRIVTRAHETKSAVPGLYNVCYINGFQAQSEDEGWWLSQHRDLVLQSGGVPVKDPDWNELFLDITTAAKRDALAAIVGGWITECRSSGFQAVEIDNLDSYTRTGGKLRADQAVAFLRLLSDRAHRAGLAVGQKNTPDLSSRRSELGTDFAVAEECNRYDECDAYTGSYGDHVLLVEYRQADFTKGCARWPQLSIVLRDVNVVTHTTPDHIC